MPIGQFGFMSEVCNYSPLHLLYCGTMRDDGCSRMPRIRRLSWLPVCEINIADAGAESSEKGNFLLNVVAHGKMDSLGRASDLRIPRSRGQACNVRKRCQPQR
jgi:hypothetical protein